MATTARPLLITLQYPPQVGGVANYYYSLVQATAQPITVLTTEQLPQPWWRMILVLLRQCHLNNYTHILVGQVLPLGTIAWIVKFILGIRYSVFIHGMDILVPQQYPRKRWLLHHILRQADTIITVSNFTKQAVLKFEPRVKRSVIIHPAATITPKIPPKPVPGIPNQFILSVGRLVERKGFDQVIKSLSQFPELHYVIAGNGDDKARLEQLVMDHSVGDRVHFYHHMSNHEIAYLYQQCLFLVMPSRQLSDGDVEGFGIVALEANRFGKAALGGKAGGMADAIQDGRTGVLVDGNDLTAISTGIKRLLDSTYREQLQSAAKLYSEGQTWDDAAKQLVDLLN